MNQVGRRRLRSAGAREPRWRLDVECLCRVRVLLDAVRVALSGQMEHHVRVHVLDKGLNGRLVGQVNAEQRRTRSRIGGARDWCELDDEPS